MDADETRAPIGQRGTPRADRVGAGSGLGAQHALTLVGAAGAQVVQMRDRQLAQALEARVGIHRERALQQVAGRRAGQGGELTIHLGQQHDVSACVALSIGMRRAGIALDQRLAGHEARHQSFDLGRGVAGGGPQVAQQQPAFGPFAACVAKATQHLGDVGVARGIVATEGKLHVARTTQKLPHLLERADLGLVHVDHHQGMIDSPAHTPKQASTSPVQDHSSLESRLPVQDHTSLDKTA